MSNNKTVLLIDGEKRRRDELKLILDFIDYGDTHVADAHDWQAAAEAAGTAPDVVLVGGDDSAILSVVDALEARFPKLPLLYVYDRADPAGRSVELQARAVSALASPIKYAQLIAALHLAEVYQASRHGTPEARAPMLFRSLVGNSRGIRQVRRLIEQVADSDANVLILGESGTGKEVVARNLHYHSSRRDKPFVPVNCGAIPPDLLESELFGHEKGAFTGALCARQGRFEMAEGGTLFLDEIGDMPLTMQVKLLRVLQERVYERVGSNKSQLADVRIVAATHRNLEEEIAEGSFREDLYYRLHVFPIEMPPLRERTEDIPLLVEELVRRLERERRGSTRLTPAAIAALCQYPWPGNVRELSNLMERLVIMFPYGVVDVRDLPEKFRGDYAADSIVELEEYASEAGPAVDNGLLAPVRLPREGIDLKEHLSTLELSLIRQALDEADGVVAHAAKRLNMRRTTLVEKMRKYGLHRPEVSSL